MLVPFMFFFIAFTVIPVVSSVVLSFFSYDMVSLPHFSGLENYLRMVSGDEVFPKALVNTLKFSVVTGPVSYLLAFLLAWLINEFGKTARSILSFLFYAPALVGNAYFIWQIAFSGDSYGYINSFLINFGFIESPINWFRNVNYNFGILVFVQLWMSMGVSFLADIAGLQNVNPELYEAGAIDGIRNRWHELWYITLPSMVPQLVFGAVMQIVSSFTAADVPMALTGFPSAEYATQTIVSHILDYSTLRYELGYASAVAVFLFVLMIVSNKAVGKLLRAVGH